MKCKRAKPRAGLPPAGIVALLLPVFVIDVALKVLRIRLIGSAADAVTWADQLRSDVAFAFGSVLVLAGLAAVARGAAGRLLITVIAYCWAATVLVASLVSHVFMVVTGTHLDTAVVAAALRDFGAVQQIVRSAVPWWIALVLLGGAALMAIMPWRLQVSERASRHTSARPILVGAILVAVALLPTATVASSFGRQSALSLLAGAVKPPVLDVPDDYLAPSAEDLRAHRLADLEPVPRSEAKNVVIVTLESTRWSATSFAGELRTTPFLERLARTSTIAERAYTTVPHTSKALTGIHCGVMPPLDATGAERSPGGILAPCLPRLLGSQGYRSVFMQSATKHFERRSDLVAGMGFEEFIPVDDMATEGFSDVNYFGYEDDVMLPELGAWLDEKGAEPFLASLLTVATHHDYVLPEGFARQRLSADAELDRYLNLVRYEDRFVEQVVSELEDRGLMDSTVLVVVGDHGEAFGEHGTKQHDGTIHDEGTRVPFLVHDGSNPVGRTVAEPVSTASVPATVAEMLGHQVVGGRYAPALGDDQGPLLVSCYRPMHCAATIDWPYKFIHHFGLRPDEVYDLDVDPYERKNLASGWGQRRLDAMRDELVRRLAWHRDLTELSLESP